MLLSAGEENEFSCDNDVKVTDGSLRFLLRGIGRGELAAVVGDF